MRSNGDPRVPLVVMLTALLCASCATVSPIRPPAELLRDCVVGDTDFSTNAGLSRSLLAYKQALGLCNADKAALREWAK